MMARVASGKKALIVGLCLCGRAEPWLSPSSRLLRRSLELPRGCPRFGTKSHFFSSTENGAEAVNQGGSIPTIEQLRSDSFIKQVQHSEKVVSLLAEASIQEGANALVEELLTAQLSHGDGIRGFFVTYLTGGGATPLADAKAVPPPLRRAMQQVDDSSDLVKLCCMNAIMPTAMVTMHKDEELSRQSKVTAERGIRVLASLLEDDDDNNPSRELAVNHCQAILSVALGNEEEHAAAADEQADREGEDLCVFWTRFFQKWGYQDVQKRDIAEAMRSALSAPKPQ